MEIRISVTDGELADLESLDEWLRGKRELAGRVRLAGPQPRAGELGTPSESIIVAAVGSGGAITLLLSALVGSLKAWLSLPRRSDLTIKIHLPDGSTVEINAERVKAGDLDAMVYQIRQALDTRTGME